jgi:hypothetical protein
LLHLLITKELENVEGVINHISWFSQESAEYYGRKHSLVDSTIVASKLANSVGLADNVELEFRTKGDYSELKKAFP